MRKKCQVIMLPKINPENCLGLIKCIKDWQSAISPEEVFNNIGDIFYGKNISSGVFEFWEPQILYFISNDEIDEGDWFLNCFGNRIENGGNILRCTKIDGDSLWSSNPDSIKTGLISSGGFYKIIASTDPSLGLPAIPEEWIRDVYVPSNGSIMDVILEMEEYNHYGGPFGTDCSLRLKLINNEVCIVEKDRYYSKALIEAKREAVKNTYKLKGDRLKPESVDQFEKIEKLKAELIDESLEKDWKEFEDLPRKTYSLQELIDKRKDQELENVAKLYVASKSQRISNTQTYNMVQDAFKAGANWKQEQSKNDVVECLEWLLNNEEDYFRLTKWIQQKTSSKDVYELWEDSKKK